MSEFELVYVCLYCMYIWHNRIELLPFSCVFIFARALSRSRYPLIKTISGNNSKKWYRTLQKMKTSKKESRRRKKANGTGCHIIKWWKNEEKKMKSNSVKDLGLNFIKWKRKWWERKEKRQQQIHFTNQHQQLRVCALHGNWWGHPFVCLVVYMESVSVFCTICKRAAKKYSDSDDSCKWNSGNNASIQKERE